MDRRSRHLPVPPQRPTPRPERLRAPSDHAISAGTEIGGFEVVRELGRTGLSVILEARQDSRDRRALLKVLSRSLSDSPQAVRRFHAEAALAARLSHPAIVPVFSAASEGGYEYYATAFLNGPTLAEFIDGAVGYRGEEFFRQAALRMAGVARTVEALHRSGVLHRKLTPANLFLDGDQLLVTDFEMAVDLQSGERPVEVLGPGKPVRSGIYLAPEEFLCGAPLDARTDVYALGMTLYELAAGLPPFPRCTEEDLARLKLTRKPPCPRRLNPEVPLGLEAVIRQATEGSPTLRHSTAAELAQDLERFASRKRGPTRRHGSAGPIDGAAAEEEEDGDSLPDFARVD